MLGRPPAQFPYNTDATACWRSRSGAVGMPFMFAPPPRWLGIYWPPRRLRPVGPRRSCSQLASAPADARAIRRRCSRPPLGLVSLPTRRRASYIVRLSQGFRRVVRPCSVQSLRLSLPRLPPFAQTTRPTRAGCVAHCRRRVGPFPRQSGSLRAARADCTGSLGPRANPHGEGQSQRLAERRTLPTEPPKGSLFSPQ